MSNKYSVNEVSICTFTFEDGIIKSNLNEFPQTRLCVINKEAGFAIDVRHELKYDFLETVSGLYFVSRAIDKINGNKRVAVFPLVNLGLTEEERVMVNNIIKKLEAGCEFIDGNDALSNDEYLKVLELERLNYREKKKSLKKKK